MEKSYCYRYPHPAVAVECVVFMYDKNEIYILLVQRANDPYKGYWAFPGGFMDIDETAETAAIRELKEETELEISKIQQFGAFSEIDRDPRERVVTIAFYSIMKNREDRIYGGDDAEKAQWFKMNEVPKLAFDHELILTKIREKIKTKLKFEPMDTEFHEDNFSPGEIMKIIIKL